MYSGFPSQASVIALEGVGIWAIFNGLGKHSNELSIVELGIMQKDVIYHIEAEELTNETTAS